ncbi:hypothetical protein EVAR_13841_1 [Eumeta japonica]|uniref:Uncharacterized protein n=1 Tax=Eumeta variegata TaxID=151549 RepID=A0A4C1U1A5_EUMVA|nr:hypothetical protein EVAR_13841_1 [Eumeta japonica]
MVDGHLHPRYMRLQKNHQYVASLSGGHKISNGGVKAGVVRGVRGEWATGTLTYWIKCNRGNRYFTILFCESEVLHQSNQLIFVLQPRRREVSGHLSESFAPDAVRMSPPARYP